MHMATHIKRWTLEEVHSLPDDGNRYELVDGELFVTPPPSVGHEEVLAVLTPILSDYVRRWRLGRVYHPRAVIRARGSEVEPDLMVRPVAASPSAEWSELLLPILVVEISSGTTRRRDQMQKRAFYLRLGIPEYWIVDRRAGTIWVVRPGLDDLACKDSLIWQPTGAAEPLVLDVSRVFREAAGG